MGGGGWRLTDNLAKKEGVVAAALFRPTAPCLCVCVRALVVRACLHVGIRALLYSRTCHVPVAMADRFVTAGMPRGYTRAHVQVAALNTL